MWTQEKCDTNLTNDDVFHDEDEKSYIQLANSTITDQQYLSLKSRLSDIMEHQNLFDAEVFDTLSHSQRGLDRRKESKYCFDIALGFSRSQNSRFDSSNNINIKTLFLPNGKAMQSLELQNYLYDITMLTKLLRLRTPYSFADIIVKENKAMLHWSILFGGKTYSGMISNELIYASNEALTYYLVESSVDILHIYNSMLTSETTLKFCRSVTNENSGSIMHVSNNSNNPYTTNCDQSGSNSYLSSSCDTINSRSFTCPREVENSSSRFNNNSESELSSQKKKRTKIPIEVQSNYNQNEDFRGLSPAFDQLDLNMKEMAQNESLCTCGTDCSTAGMGSVFTVGGAVGHSRGQFLPLSLSKRMELLYNSSKRGAGVGGSSFGTIE